MKIEKDIVAVGEILFDCYPDHKIMGGAPFNFLYHIWHLTGFGKFVSRIGDDSLGREILSILKNRNFDTQFMQLDSKHKTGTVEVRLDENKVPEYIIEENTAYDFIELNDEIKNYVNEKDSIVYLGTLAQRNSISRETIQTLSRMSTNVFYDVNLRQNFYTKEILNESLINSDVVKINEDELKTINDLLINSEYDFVKTSQNLTKKYNIKMLCVTLGEDGAALFKHGEINKHKHTVENVVDTVGAGDAYSAVLCLGYLYEWELSNINKMASQFAAEICTIRGAVPEDSKFYNKYSEIIQNEH